MSETSDWDSPSKCAKVVARFTRLNLNDVGGLLGELRSLTRNDLEGVISFLHGYYVAVVPKKAKRGLALPASVAFENMMETSNMVKDGELNLRSEEIAMIKKDPEMFAYFFKVQEFLKEKKDKENEKS